MYGLFLKHEIYKILIPMMYDHITKTVILHKTRCSFKDPNTHKLKCCNRFCLTPMTKEDVVTTVTFHQSTVKSMVEEVDQEK